MQYERKQYLDKLIQKKGNGRIKIITGLRRCGKSYLLFSLYKNNLLSDGVEEDQIIELALDEVGNARYRNPFELDAFIKARMTDRNKRYYIFLDEIQFVSSVQNPYVDNPEEKITFVDVSLVVNHIPGCRHGVRGGIFFVSNHRANGS